MKIAIDFDGVLVKHVGIVREGDFMKLEPIKDAKDAVDFFLDKGHEIYVLTAREEKEWEKVAEWLWTWEFPQLEVTNKKKLGTTIYIDDRAVRFTNWQDVCKYFG